MAHNFKGDDYIMSTHNVARFFTAHRQVFAARDDHRRRYRAVAVPAGPARRPLWQPLCYAQICGLTVATFITLLMVPVLYSIFVLDLKILSWGAKEEKSEDVVAVAPGPYTEATSGD